jgi:Mor family transcriptional regulator
MAFTEQGVAMLSSVLKSKQAVQVNIGIMRAFVQIREMMDSNKELAEKIAELEKKYDGQFTIVFNAIRGLIYEKRQPRERIGFRKDKI